MNLVTRKHKYHKEKYTSPVKS